MSNPSLSKKESDKNRYLERSGENDRSNKVKGGGGEWFVGGVLHFKDEKYILEENPKQKRT